MGEVVGLTRMEEIQTGMVLTPSGKADELPQPEKPQPVYGLAIHAEKRGDDVKLTGSIGRLIEEDPTLELEQNAEMREMVLWGQGDVHLQIALDRLRNRQNLSVVGHHAAVPVQGDDPPGHPAAFALQAAERRARPVRRLHDRGQVRCRAAPGSRSRTASSAARSRATTSRRSRKALSRRLRHGPLGFPVVDLAVNLITGQFHAVDSSDMAFKTAGRQAIQEALPKCEPILLEPIDLVEISVPNAFTARVQRLVSGRRGQILGYDAKPDWPGWDVVRAHLPQSELHDLIVELRSLTLGVGSFAHQFDHMAELTGRPAEKVIQSRAAEAAQ